jgi:hypothetical protein
MPYTKADIRENMRINHDWLERGILAISNNNGFSDNDKDYLSYLARWIQSGKPLNGKHLRKARALMMKYARQLVKIANTQQQNTISFGACYK